MQCDARRPFSKLSVSDKGGDHLKSNLKRLAIALVHLHISVYYMYSILMYNIVSGNDKASSVGVFKSK